MLSMPVVSASSDWSVAFCSCNAQTATSARGTNAQCPNHLQRSSVRCGEADHRDVKGGAPRGVGVLQRLSRPLCAPSPALCRTHPIGAGRVGADVGTHTFMSKKKGKSVSEVNCTTLVFGEVFDRGCVSIVWYNRCPVPCLLSRVLVKVICGGGLGREALEGGGRTPRQPMPSHCPSDAKCRLQRHL